MLVSENGNTLLDLNTGKLEMKNAKTEEGK